MSGTEKVLAVTLCRRPGLTRQLLSALAACYGISDYRLLISCDVSPEYEAACEEVISLARGFDACETQVHINRPQRGIDLAKLFIVPKAFELSSLVVFLEDDCIPSPDALRYFEHAGDEYRDNDDVLSISGYKRTGTPIGEIDPYKLGFRRRFCSWGWAMHKSRWESLFGGRAARYLLETGDQANGLWDHWINQNLRPGQGEICPELSRIWLAGGEDAEHTPSAAYHMQYDDNGHCWAGQLLLPDPAPAVWTMGGIVEELRFHPCH